MASRIRTVRLFLACWNLPLGPYTVDVVYALCASLTWLVLEVMPDLPASEAAWSTSGPWRPTTSLIHTAPTYFSRPRSPTSFARERRRTGELTPARGRTGELLHIGRLYPVGPTIASSRRPDVTRVP